MPYGQETVVVDCLREAKPPFSPEAVVKEYSDLFKSYGITTIIGDKYALEWPIEVFGKQGIRYEQSAAPKSELYIGLLRQDDTIELFYRCIYMGPSWCHD
jgi:hypothetical protein